MAVLIQMWMKKMATTITLTFTYFIKVLTVKKNIVALVAVSAFLGLGSAEAAYVSVVDATGNGSMATALSLNPYFDKSFDANIGKFDTNLNNSTVTNISTTFFHASANATTGTAPNTMDWYSFATTTTNVQAYFDIDNTSTNLNSWIKLYNSAGVQIGSNNNRTAQDAGTTVTTNSYLSSVLANPGLYFVSVGRASGGAQAALTAGQAYTLHVSIATAPVAAAAAVPVPATAWLFGSGLTGLMVSLSRKKKMAAPLALVTT